MLHQQSSPLRVSFNQACELLCLSRSGLRKLIERTPDFPKPIKSGVERQSLVFFDYQELVEWHKSTLK